MAVKNMAVMKGGVVQNVVRYDTETVWKPPAGCFLAEVPVGTPVNPGDAWNGVKFISYQPTAAEVAAEAQDAADDSDISDMLSRGRQALASWDSLTTAQKYAVLKQLLRYVLRKERT